jgi:hypothetical protein
MATPRPRAPEQLVARFIGAWNAETGSERRRLLELTCNQQTRFTSAQGEHMGVEAQLDAIAAFHRHFPKGLCKARLLMEHHGWLLIAWVTEFGDGRPPLAGIDTGVLGPGGRFAQIVSFSPVPLP